MAFYVVLRRTGPEWDRTRPLEQQSGWQAHAEFMDGLVDDGFVVLGGPLADEVRVVLAVEAESVDAVRHEDGTVEVEDHDELATARDRGWLPEADAELALRVADEMERALRDHVEPWGEEGWRRLRAAQAEPR